MQKGAVMVVHHYSVPKAYHRILSRKKQIPQRKAPTHKHLQQINKRHIKYSYNLYE